MKHADLPMIAVFKLSAPSVYARSLMYTNGEHDGWYGESIYVLRAAYVVGLSRCSLKATLCIFYF